MCLWWGATTYGIYRVGHTEACASKISEGVDPLNNLEAGRWGVGLSLIGARAFGWLDSIELGKTPGEPIACEGWSRRGL